ncbi:MAG: hypothetical protein V7L13_01990 [Nostoc sp.]|uniref:hypothetical protein n=1 Tax=Nostoc sp. TaxID=1180 RepID=UPI002FFB7DCA
MSATGYAYAKPVWAAILALFLGRAFFVWINQLLKLSKNRLRGVDHNSVKLLRIQFALSGRARCPCHNHIGKILVQIKGATA